MSQVNVEIPAVQPLMMTVGDEFQGLYTSLADGIKASMRIMLALMPDTDVRIGIGWGELTVASENPPFGQDGPCWWRARDAIDDVKRSESTNSSPKSVRTICRTETKLDSLINAYLLARDHLVGQLDTIDLQILRLKRSGSTQVEISHAIGLGQSSVSRRLQSHGILALLAGEPDVIPLDR